MSPLLLAPPFLGMQFALTPAAAVGGRSDGGLRMASYMAALIQRGIKIQDAPQAATDHYTGRAGRQTDA